VLLIAVMLGLALAAGVLAAAFVARHPALDPAAPRAAEPAARAIEHEIHAPGPLGRLLRSRLDARATTGLLLTVGVAVVAVLGVLVFQVRDNTGIVHLDRTIEHWADSHATAASRAVLRAVTDLGATLVAVGVGLVVAFLERRRLANRSGPNRNRPGRNVFLYLSIVIGGQWVIAQLIKLGVGRTRPVLGIAAGLDGSFPSGHSASASATYAACALVIGMARSRRTQTLLTGAAVAIAVAVASSRVLLGLHWFSDVLGGLALGWAWFALVSLAFGGRLLRFGVPVELAERHETLQDEATPAPEDGPGRPAGQAGRSAPSSRMSSSKSER
jgi:membrane-associated phospholipid phosphatase